MKESSITVPQADPITASMLEPIGLFFMKNSCIFLPERAFNGEQARSFTLHQFLINTLQSAQDALLTLKDITKDPFIPTYKSLSKPGNVITPSTPQTPRVVDLVIKVWMG